MIKRYDIEDWKSLYDLAESTIKLQESAIAERDALLREADLVMTKVKLNDIRDVEAVHTLLNKIREVIGE